MAQKIIESGKMNGEGWKKIGKGLLIALAGALVTFLVDLPNAYDFGKYSIIVVAVASTLVNFLRKWLTSYKSK